MQSGEKSPNWIPNFAPPSESAEGDSFQSATPVSSAAVDLQSNDQSFDASPSKSSEANDKIVLDAASSLDVFEEDARSSWSEELKQTVFKETDIDDASQDEAHSQQDIKHQMPDETSQNSLNYQSSVKNSSLIEVLDEKSVPQASTDQSVETKKNNVNSVDDVKKSSLCESLKDSVKNVQIVSETYSGNNSEDSLRSPENSELPFVCDVLEDSEKSIQSKDKTSLDETSQEINSSPKSDFSNDLNSDPQEKDMKSIELFSDRIENQQLELKPNFNKTPQDNDVEIACLDQTSQKSLKSPVDNPCIDETSNSEGKNPQSFKRPCEEGSGGSNHEKFKKLCLGSPKDSAEPCLDFHNSLGSLKDGEKPCLDSHNRLSLKDTEEHCLDSHNSLGSSPKNSEEPCLDSHNSVLSLKDTEEHCLDSHNSLGSPKNSEEPCLDSHNSLGSPKNNEEPCLNSPNSLKDSEEPCLRSPTNSEEPCLRSPTNSEEPCLTFQNSLGSPKDSKEPCLDSNNSLSFLKDSEDLCLGSHNSLGSPKDDNEPCLESLKDNENPCLESHNSLGSQKDSKESFLDSHNSLGSPKCIKEPCLDSHNSLTSQKDNEELCLDSRNSLRSPKSTEEPCLGSPKNGKESPCLEDNGEPYLDTHNSLTSPKMTENPLLGSPKNIKEPPSLDSHESLGSLKDSKEPFLGSLKDIEEICMDNDIQGVQSVKNPCLNDNSDDQNLEKTYLINDSILENVNGTEDLELGVDETLQNNSENNDVSSLVDPSITKEKKREFPPEKLYEYMWPQEKGELYILQEQICDYLEVKSFKRKYPNLVRRSVDMDERQFLREKNVVTEMQCDLGLTALRSEDVLELMSKDYPDHYEEYITVLREREQQSINEKQKEIAAINADKNKMFELIKKAVKSAADYNAHLNQERREERKSCMDLQTFTVHYPVKGKEKIKKSTTKPGKYPVALLPGQFQDYYKEYTPEELKYLPVNTVVYGPLKELSSIKALSDGSQSDSDDSTASDGSYSSSQGTHDESSSSSEKTDSNKKATATPATPYIPKMKPNAVCKVCKTGADGKTKDGKLEEIVHCSQCDNSAHPSCIELTADNVNILKTYPWQCMDCKVCSQCKDPNDEDKMLFCDICDRGYHTFCVGLKNLPQGKWICRQCGSCSICGANQPGPETSKTQWQYDIIKTYDSSESKNQKPKLVCQMCYKKRR